MDDSENPFLPPASDERTPAETSSDRDEGVDPRTIGKARYVPTVAILMIVHGALMLVASLVVIGMMIFLLPQLSQQIAEQQRIQRQQNPNAPQIGDEAMTMILSAVYGGMAAVLFLIGGLNIYAGIRNFSYHNRILGIVSMVLNMVSILFCWCLPLSIGLLVFGMIIYLSPEADRAFQWQSGPRKRAVPTP